MEYRVIAVLTLLLIPLLTISSLTVVSGDSTNGSFTFTVSGYTVTGQLSDSRIEHGGTVQMLMSIDQTTSTAYGPAHITGTAVWSGETNLQNANGFIANLSGTVQVCAVFYCQNADFTGSGTWGGTLSWSSGPEYQGSGTFQGTITFSGSQITQNGPVPVSGNWTAYFES